MPPPLSPSIWLEADSGVYKDAGVTLCADGDTVQQWTDQSGNANHASQATAGNRPTYHTAYLPGGLPAVVMGTGSVGMTTALSLTGSYTIAAVFAGAAYDNAAHRAVQGSSNWLIGPYSNSISHYAGGWVTGRSGFSTGCANYMAADLQRVIVTNSGAATHAYVNGVDYTQSSSPTGTPGTLSLGASGAFAEPLNGPIVALIAYNSVLSAGNIALLDTHLKRWMTPVQTFAGPPPIASLGGALRTRCGFFYGGIPAVYPSDRVTGIHAVSGGGTTTPTIQHNQWGPYASWAGLGTSGVGLRFAAATRPTLPGAMTLFTVARIGPLTGSRPTFVVTGNNNGIGLCLANSNGFNPMLWKPATTVTVTTIGWPSGSWVAYAAVWRRDSSTIQFYIRNLDTGGFQSFTATDSAVPTWTSLDVAVNDNINAGGTLGGIDGDILVSGFSYSAWTQAQFARFVADPYWPVRPAVGLSAPLSVAASKTSAVPWHLFFNRAV